MVTFVFKAITLADNKRCIGEQIPRASTPERGLKLPASGER